MEDSSLGDRNGEHRGVTQSPECFLESPLQTEGYVFHPNLLINSLIHLIDSSDIH